LKAARNLSPVVLKVKPSYLSVSLTIRKIKAPLKCYAPIVSTLDTFQGMFLVSMILQVSPHLDRGNKCECKIIEKTGGGDLWLGLNIQITKLQEDYDALVQRRLREIAAGESVSQTINCSIEANSHNRAEGYRGSSNVTLLWSALVALVVLAVLALAFFIVSR
jgi:hypothetical protein